VVVDRFYPIVPDLAWLKRLAPLGIKTIQLRLKDVSAETAAQSIVEAIGVARSHGVQLIINDFWREAIDAGASFIHLGQEDLATADLQAISKAGLALGVSTHSEAELENALGVDPDYIALGPIYETKLKVMPWAPQGLERIGQWKARIGKRHLVAIGGITLDRAPAVMAAGADSVALITDFLTAPDPENRVQNWVTWAADKPGCH
jgi:thiamine-phosphate pyrophosphorylase